MTLDGKTIKTWTHTTMIEPMCVAIDNRFDHVLVGDSSCNIHVFSAITGQHLFTVCQLKLNKFTYFVSKIKYLYIVLPNKFLFYFFNFSRLDKQ